MHNYLVASILCKYGEAAKKDALAELRDCVGEAIDSVPVGSNASVCQSEVYTCSVKVAKPRTQLSKELLRAKLLTKFKLQPAEVDEFISSCETETKPARTVEVIEAV